MSTSTKKTLPEGTTKADLAEKMPQSITVVIGGQTIVADAREFSSGSLGWYANGKVQVTLEDGTKVTCQVGGNITIVGSKELS